MPTNVIRLICFSLAFISSNSLNFGCSPLLRKSNGRAASPQVRTEVIDQECPLVLANESLCAKIDLLSNADDPIVVGEPTSFLVSFWDRKTGTIEGPYLDPTHRNLTVFVRLWMNMASGSHGSLAVGIQRFRDADGNEIPGVYQVSRAIFTMKGLWEIRVELHDKDRNTVDEAIHPIDI